MTTRSQARHERRKRLKIARKAAETDPRIFTEKTNLDPDVTNDSKTPGNRNVTEIPSKSKARRLRKLNKTVENCDNIAIIENPPPRIRECVQEVIVEETIDKRYEPIGSENHDCPTEKSNPPKLIASEHELLENEKNLKITKSSRSSASPFLDRIESTGNSEQFIINKASPCCPEVETKIVAIDRSDSSLRVRVEASDEVPLNDFSSEISPEAPKISSSVDPASSTGRMISSEKTREQVKAEREAKKAAKAAAKSKSKVPESKPEAPEVTPSAAKSTRNPAKKLNVDAVDGEVAALTNKLAITDSRKKPEVAPIKNEGKSEVRSKSELRADRRAKQEAQRAAKQEQVAEKIKPKSAKTKVETTKKPRNSSGKDENSTVNIANRPIPKENSHEVNLFKHLYHERAQAWIKVPTVNSTIHPAIVRLGVQYANKIIVGSNARCVALLAAVKQLIEDFERPSQADFTRGLETCLQESSAYLHHCRPLAVSMQNALRHLKWQMTQLTAATSDKEAKIKLGTAIDTYILEQIHLADKAISITIQTKISDCDVILIYGYSSLIQKILCDAHDAGKKFRVVVVDGRPWLEGREMLRRLAKHGLECSYVLINALSFIMPQVSKVFLGAHAILANGAVMSRVGTAQVALMAKAFNVPVLVACETHKTCERVQTDSIVYNEIADADELAENLMGSSDGTTLLNWRAKKSLNLLNLTYDVTPADLVTAVVTELAILPCTSVPVILRIKPSEI